MSILGRAAKAAFRTTWGDHRDDTAQAFRWSIVCEEYEKKARAAIEAFLRDADTNQRLSHVLFDTAPGDTPHDVQRVIDALLGLVSDNSARGGEQ